MLQSLIQSNSLGFPIAYVKPDAVTLNSDELPPIDKISQSIDYVDGFPIVDGLPIWERLDCEPIQFYDLFKSYRNQAKTSSVRSLKTLSHNACVQSSFIHALNNMYHWQFRCSSFDRFNQELLNREREHTIKLVETKHYKAGEELFEICMNQIKKWEKEGFLVKSSLKELKDLLETAAKFQLRSLGVSIDAPRSETDLAPVRNTINLNVKDNQLTSSKDKNAIGKLQQVLDILVYNKALPKPITTTAENEPTQESGEQ